MFTRAFWIATAERAIKTFAQTLAALLVADGTGLIDASWGPQLSVAGMALVVSVLTSIASSGAGAPGPSLANERVPGRHARILPLEAQADADAAGNDRTVFPYTS